MAGFKHDDGTMLLRRVGKQLRMESAPFGGFCRAELATASSQAVIDLGQPALPRKDPRWVAHFRQFPWWIEVAFGSELNEVPKETQLWIGRLADGRALLIAPLIDTDAAWRVAIRGSAKGLELVIDTGDATVRADEGLVAYVAALDPADPDQWRLAAAVVADRLGSVRPRWEKSLPEIVDQFGWCTWDAFYKEVSHDKVQAGLQGFADCGVEPRWIILDDGWQPVAEQPNSKDQALTGFAANDKFAGDLAPTVAMAKQAYAIERFYVWHAYMGYWGGVDPQALAGYGVRERPICFSEDMADHFDIHGPDHSWFNHQIGVVDRDHIHRFYQDYHRQLASAGVDGVKVDNQSTLESVADGQGGRVRQMGLWREALEGSTQVHFGGELINCMSCSIESLYQTKASSLTRSSNDFFPKRPETHAQHIIVNSHFGQWFGNFVHPDWDMFHSKHEWGHFHAVGRAVSGGPIYVSDKPGQHDAELLASLVFEDGSVALCDEPGQPSPACLFDDPTDGRSLYKVGNRIGDAAVVGVFHCGVPKGKKRGKVVETEVGVADVAGYQADISASLYGFYAQGTGAFAIGDADTALEVALRPGEADLVSIIPLGDERFLPIGLIDKLNVAGSVKRDISGWAGDDIYACVVRGGGRFLAWSSEAPVQVLCNNESLDVHFDEDSGGVSVEIPGSDEGPVTALFCF